DRHGAAVGDDLQWPEHPELRCRLLRLKPVGSRLARPRDVLKPASTPCPGGLTMCGSRSVSGTGPAGVAPPTPAFGDRPADTSGSLRPCGLAKSARRLLPSQVSRDGEWPCGSERWSPRSGV